jgi:vacuolar protein sorting-associated protein 13A/C
LESKFACIAAFFWSVIVLISYCFLFHCKQSPVGLIRDLGDGVSDFLSEPIKGFKKSLQELDPMYVVDGVAKGTGSLARHAVGGFADSASMLTETLSKNMAVLTLDRRYAQQRDRTLEGRSEGGFVDGIGSGSIKIVKGVVDGVTGVVRQPIKGAERSGVEGFTKGLGKGLIGLVVKPVIGLSDAATDLMIGVKGSIEKGADVAEKAVQVRPRRVLYGEEKAIRVYNFSDARVAYLLSKIKLVVADKYLSHLDWGELIAILTTKRLVMLSDTGTVKQVLKYSRIKAVRVGSESANQLVHAAVVHFMLHSSTTVPILCPSFSSAKELCRLVTEAMNLDATRRREQQNSRR